MGTLCEIFPKHHQLFCGTGLVDLI